MIAAVSTTTSHEIHRRRTAIGRAQVSRPVRLALESGLLSNQRTLFDYGCGRGQDLHRLKRLGIEADGWDPAHQPVSEKKPADVVNLGYVVNVIEDEHERRAALEEAWSLTEQILVVAARLDIERKRLQGDEYADGCVTSRDTFQKLYSQQELRDWVSETLEAPAIPAAPGVVFVFRDEALRHSYLAARYQRRRGAPQVRKADQVFEQHRNTLGPLIQFLTARGRLPARHELENVDELEANVGSIRQACAILRRVIGEDAWLPVREERTTELLIYLALEKIAGRPKFSELPDTLQLDVKEFFSSYKAACTEADRLLLQSGDRETRDQAMRESPVGKLTGNALYVHVDALPGLPTVLRVYEGCARQYVGDIEGANVVKLNREKPQISYLVYPGFRRDPHPAINASLIVRLGNPQIRNWDYADSRNPGILHRKEELLPLEHPDREKFARLTRQEENWGLYEDSEKIGTSQGWQAVLEAKGLTHKGHRLVKRKTVEAPGEGSESSSHKFTWGSGDLVIEEQPRKGNVSDE